MRGLLLGLFGLAACTPVVEDSEACPMPKLAVVRTMKFARITEGVSEGFDLDGEESVRGGPSGCGQPDLLSPAGEPGVDNALASLLPLLELTEARVVEELLQIAIDIGELLILLEISGGDGAPESCSGFRLLRAEDLPLIGTDGRVLPGQTLRLEAGQRELPVMPATVEGGRTFARDFAFELPIQVFDANLYFEFDTSAVRIDPTEDPQDPVLRGVIGGGAAWQPVVEQLEQTGVATEVKELLRTVVAQIADLSPDASGACQSMSAAFTFEAVEAFVYDEAAEVAADTE